MVLFGERVTARGRILLAATPDVETFLLLPEGTLLVAADPVQLFLHTHPGPPALPGTQLLLLHRAARTLLLAREDNRRQEGDTTHTHTHLETLGTLRHARRTHVTTVELHEAEPQFGWAAELRHCVVGAYYLLYMLWSEQSPLDHVD